MLAFALYLQNNLFSPLADRSMCSVREEDWPTTGASNPCYTSPEEFVDQLLRNRKLLIFFFCVYFSEKIAHSF